jgi:hypothetical protein
MIKNLKSLVIKLAVASALLFPALVPAAVYAQDSPLQQQLCGGAESLQIGQPGSCTDAEAEDSVNRLITTAINIISVIVGIVAVVMIIWGGFKYITSGGDSGNISAAKNTILFAIVGLIIVALAQIIVRFVLSRAVSGGQ